MFSFHLPRGEAAPGFEGGYGVDIRAPPPQQGKFATANASACTVFEKQDRSAPRRGVFPHAPKKRTRVRERWRKKMFAFWVCEAQQSAARWSLAHVSAATIVWGESTPARLPIDSTAWPAQQASWPVRTLSCAARVIGMSLIGTPKAAGGWSLVQKGRQRRCMRVLVDCAHDGFELWGVSHPLLQRYSCQAYSVACFPCLVPPPSWEAELYI